MNFERLEAGKAGEKVAMNEWMHEGMTDGMTDWLTEWMKEWTNERTKEPTNERMNERTNERTDERTNERTNERMNEWMIEWINDASRKKSHEGRRRSQKSYRSKRIKTTPCRGQKAKKTQIQYKIGCICICTRFYRKKKKKNKKKNRPFTLLSPQTSEDRWMLQNNVALGALCCQVAYLKV